MAIHEASSKILQTEQRVNQEKGNPIKRGFVYINPNDKSMTPLVEGLLVLHNHPDKDNTFFVVPLYDKDDLRNNYSELCLESWVKDTPDSVLVAHLKLGEYKTKREIESWILVDVYSEEFCNNLYPKL